MTPLDKCNLLEAMNDNHVLQLLPRLRQADERAAGFAQRCLDDKVPQRMPSLQPSIESNAHAPYMLPRAC